MNKRNNTMADKLPDLLDTLPPPVRGFITNQRAGLKDQPTNPDDFYGRDGELYGLMSAVKTVTDRSQGASARPAEVVAAAPGAGKTSLLKAFERRLAEEGIGNVRLDPKDMITPEAFSTAVKQQPPYCYWANAKNVLKKTADTFVIVIDAAVYAGTYAAAKTASAGQAEVPNTEVTARVIESWRDGGTPRPVDVVQAINTMWRAGTVITVDEAQDLADLAKTTAQKNCSTEIISALASHDPRERAGVDRATICFFGLADTPDTVHELGSPTVNTTVLTPLHQDYVRMMIHGAVDKATAKESELREWAKTHWTEPLVEEFSDWTRHAQAATEAAHDLIREFGHELINSEWSTRAVRALAHHYKQSTYQKIRTRATAKGVEKWMRDITVQALWCNGNKVDQGTMRKLLRKYIKRSWSDLDTKDVDESVNSATRRLLRSGIMDRTDDLPNDMHEGVYYAPIPSLLQHLSEDKLGEPKVVRKLLRKRGLNDDPDKRPAKSFQPDWEYSTPETSERLAKK